MASCSPELSRSGAAHAGAFDHHVRLTLSPSDPAEKPRVGRELRLPLRRGDFKTLLAVRARRLDHSGGLEAAAAVMGLKRLGRVRRWHGHRGAFLVDARAVQAALQKGRSSAGTLRHPVAQAAALTLACDWRWRYVYLPSESNPADDPSRGVRGSDVVKTISKRSRASRSLGQSGGTLRAWWSLCRTSEFGPDFIVDRPSAGSASDQVCCAP